MHTPEELLKRAAWKKTPKGKEAIERWNQSPKGRASAKRRNMTPASKQRKKNWREKNPHYNQKRDAEQRLLIIEFYGNKCMDCSVEDPEVLTLDHVGGGGQGHREEVSKGRIEGGGIYHWVWKFISKNEKPPMNLELVCRNCNWKRHLAKLRKDMKDGIKNRQVS